MGKFSRQELLIGDEKQKKISKQKIIIFGVGGVGGYVCEILTRAGVENICIVDFDTVSESNINRQIIATESSIGQIKVDVMKKRILDINGGCAVETYNTKLTQNNIEIFNLHDYNFVVDCIDDVSAKVALIKFCYDNKIKCVSAMGTGNKIGIPNFAVKDIFKTENDPLAKKMRKMLKLACVKKHLVVCSNQDRCDHSGAVVGSFAPFPAICGCTLASYVICDILEV